MFPFKYRLDVDPTVLQLHPLYEDEEGRVYMRGIASLHSVSQHCCSSWNNATVEPVDWLNSHFRSEFTLRSVPLKRPQYRDGLFSGVQIRRRCLV